MKIQTSTLAPPEAPDSTTLSAADSARRKAAPASTPASRAQVELSPLSASLVQDSGDVDMERVTAIRNAIRSGELQIDASRIADGLLDSVRDLIRP